MNETADVNSLFFSSYACLPFSVSLVPANAIVPRRVVFVGRSVLPVFYRCGFPEVVDPVVVTDAIDMIDLVSWPNTMNVEPRKAVGEIEARKNLDAPISIGLTASRHRERPWRVYRDFPPKNTALRIVGENFAQPLCG